MYTNIIVIHIITTIVDISFSQANRLDRSAHKKNYSTKTKLRSLHDHLQRHLSSASLCLFDSFAAFDTMDHSIIFRRLSTSFSKSSLFLQWFTSHRAHLPLLPIIFAPLPLSCGISQLTTPFFAPFFSITMSSPISCLS